MNVNKILLRREPFQKKTKIRVVGFGYRVCQILNVVSL